MPRRIKNLQNLTVSAPAGKVAGKKKVLKNVKKNVNKAKIVSKKNVKAKTKVKTTKKKSFNAQILKAKQEKKIIAKPIKVKINRQVKKDNKIKSDTEIVLESIKQENKIKKNKTVKEELKQDNFQNDILKKHSEPIISNNNFLEKEQEIKKTEKEDDKIMQSDNLNEVVDNKAGLDGKLEKKEEYNINKTLENNNELEKRDEKIDENLVSVGEENIQKRSLGMYRKIALSFIILTSLLLAAVIYFSLVQVTIVLTSNQEQVSSDLSINIFDQERNFNNFNNKDGILGVIKRVEVEKSKICQATDIELINEEITGKATIINNSGSLQQLVATTRLLSSDDKLFRTKKTVFVPAGGQVEVEVYADEISRDMAIDPTSFIIPGLWAGLQDKIYAESKESMKYSRQIKKYIKQDDIDNCVKDLKLILLSNAEADVNENYQTYDQVIFDIDNNSISQKVDGAVGEERDEFKITMKTTIIVVAFMDDEIYKLTKQKLLAVMPDDKQLLNFNKDDISYILNNYKIDAGTASMNVNFAGKMIAKSGYSIIDRTKLISLNEKQISAYLDSLPEVFDYEIKFYPSFIKKAPSLADRIKIIIKQ